MSVQLVFLNGISLQVNTCGLKPYQTTVVDDGQPWLSRDKLAALRLSDDALGFDIVTLSGKRHRMTYVAADIAIPTSNVAALNGIYRKAIQTAYTLTGEGLSSSSAHSLYNTYKDTQGQWAQRAKYAAQLNDPDITSVKRDALVSAYNAIDFFSVSMSLNAPGIGVHVFFAEGNSCTFTNWVIAAYTDFEFQLITRQYM
jgi:hypothetical protein